MKLQELVSGNSSKLRVKKFSLSDTYKDDKSYREEMDGINNLITSKEYVVETLDQTIERKKQEIEDLSNKNNLELEQAELLRKEYLDYEQAIKVTSIETRNAEQGTKEKKEILQKLSLEENVLRKELIDMQDKVSSSNANLASVSIIANEKVNESNNAQLKLEEAISNLKVVEDNLDTRSSSLKKLDTTLGEKETLLKNFIAEAEEKQKQIVPLDKLLQEIHEKQEMVYQLSVQAEELKTILDEGANLSLSFESTLEEAESSFRLTMEETEKKQRVRHRLLLLEIKDLDVVVSEKSDHILDLDNAIQSQKDDIEAHKESITELMEQEQKLRNSMEDMEFRKFIKTTPEVSVVPTLGLSESPFHKKTGVK